MDCQPLGTTRWVTQFGRSLSQPEAASNSFTALTRFSLMVRLADTTGALFLLSSFSVIVRPCRSYVNWMSRWREENGIWLIGEYVWTLEPVKKENRPSDGKYSNTVSFFRKR